jgi:hypothetical protein
MTARSLSLADTFLPAISLMRSSASTKELSMIERNSSSLLLK